ncbi:hypothetical protein DRN52_01675 [Thermococci archaeon]|nr:MAG: hypothetical protein DRN52_01675 [Thermococci archaeon]
MRPLLLVLLSVTIAFTVIPLSTSEGESKSEIKVFGGKLWTFEGIKSDSYEIVVKQISEEGKVLIEVYEEGSLIRAKTIAPEEKLLVYDVFDNLIFDIRVLEVNKDAGWVELEVYAGVFQVYKGALGEGESDLTEEIAGKKYKVSVKRIGYDPRNPELSEVLLYVGDEEFILQSGESEQKGLFLVEVISVFLENQKEPKATIRIYSPQIREIKKTTLSPDLKFELDLSRNKVTPEDKIIAEITLRNEGRDKARDIELEISHPRNVLLKGEAEQEMGNLMPGAEKKIEVTLLPKAIGIGDFKVKVKYYDGKGLLRTLERSEKIIVVREAKLKVESSVDRQIVQRGSEFTLTVSIKNEGDMEGRNVVVFNNLPPEFEFVQGSSEENIPEIKGGEVSEIRYVIRAKKKGEYELKGVRITYRDSHNRLKEAVSENIPMKVVGKPEISVSRDLSKETIREGGEVEVRLLIVNLGDAEARDLKLEEKIPEIAELYFNEEREENTGSLRLSLGEIPPASTQAVIYRLKFNERGNYTIGPTKVEWIDSLGKRNATTVSEDSITVKISMKKIALFLLLVALLLLILLAKSMTRREKRPRIRRRQVIIRARPKTSRGGIPKR